jgi:hypothetical protein
LGPSKHTKVKDAGEPAILIAINVGIFEKIKDCTVAESLYHLVSSLFGSRVGETHLLIDILQSVCSAEKRQKNQINSPSNPPGFGGVIEHLLKLGM